MLSKLKFFYFVLIISALLGACAEDGEVGPQGEQGPEGDGMIFNMGYFKGTVSGTRTDGTSFSEDFSLEYTTDTISAFYNQNGEKYIDLYRKSGEEYIRMLLKQTEEGLAPISGWNTSFNFEKALNEETLFKINVRPLFDTTKAYVLALSRAKQEDYSFQRNNNLSPYYYNSYYNDNPVYVLYTYINGVYHEFYYFKADGSKADGTLLAVHNSKTGVKETEGDVFDHYNDLKFKYNEELGMPIFYDTETGEPLSEEIPETVDEFTMTNYKRDDVTGILSFDFEVKVSQYPIFGRANSTAHDLTISGSFNSGNQVFSNTINRIGE